MKTVFCFLVIWWSPALRAQDLPKLLRNPDAPAFSYMECMHNLPKKKDRYCSRYDYSFKIEKDSLFITITWNYKIDQGKDAKIFHTYYNVALKDIYVNKCIEELKWDADRLSVKDMEGNTQRRYHFVLFALDDITERKVISGEYREKAIRQLTLYADSQSDARAFLEYLKAVPKN